MRVSSYHSRAFLAGAIVVLLLAFSFNAYACLLPLSGTDDGSMANGCATPTEQPSQQLCDAFKTLGVESSPQSSLLHMDHHWSVADQMPAVSTAVSFGLVRISNPYHTLESSSPPHQSLSSTVLRI